MCPRLGDRTRLTLGLWQACQRRGRVQPVVSSMEQCNQTQNAWDEEVVDLEEDAGVEAEKGASAFWESMGFWGWGSCASFLKNLHPRLCLLILERD